MFSDRIDKWITKEVGRSTVAGLQVSRKELPSYRYVDLFRAAEVFLEDKGAVTEMASEHGEDLHRILHEAPLAWQTRSIQRSPSVPWATGPGEEAYLPTDTFWLFSRDPKAKTPNEILRVRYATYSDTSIVELASSDPQTPAEDLATISDRSLEESIYRGKVLELAMVSGIQDEFGDLEKIDRFRVLFKDVKPVADQDLIVDDDVRKILQRNVIDLHTRRDILKKHGVPVRRGVLLYGPPGTGKTFARRYVCGKLDGVTKIMVTGTALAQVKAIFMLARMLQPSLVIFEDVDLVFTHREVNLYSSVLGDLLDLMDGLRPFEDISFLLTTNSIERMEDAIKDRPGRISQCIHFDAPNPPLRRRYLQRYLEMYGNLKVELDDLVDMSDGTTQAFLKEWVHRAAQVATERLTDEEAELELLLQDFSQAMDEMRQFTEGSTGQIVGFHR
jgi:SpoVK/Ycf46/Vps4 family AAA+-type ATPase